MIGSSSVRDKFAVTIRREKLSKRFNLKRFRGANIEDLKNVDDPDIRSTLIIQKKIIKLSKEFSTFQIKPLIMRQIELTLQEIINSLTELSKINSREFNKTLEEITNENFIANINTILDEEKGEVVRLVGWLGGIICVSDDDKILNQFKIAKSGRRITNAIKRDDSPPGKTEIFTKLVYFLTNFLYSDEELIENFMKVVWGEIDQFIHKRIKDKNCKEDILMLLSILCDNAGVVKDFHIDYLKFAVAIFGLREDEDSVRDSLIVIKNFIENSKHRTERLDSLLNYLLENKFYDDLTLLISEKNVGLTFHALECISNSFFSEDQNILMGILNVKKLVPAISDILFYGEKILKENVIVLYSNIFANDGEIASIFGSDNNLIDYFFELLTENGINTPIGNRSLMCIFNIFTGVENSLLVNFLNHGENMSAVMQVLKETLIELIEDTSKKQKLKSAYFEKLSFILSIFVIIFTDCENVQKSLSEKNKKKYFDFYCEDSELLDLIDNLKIEISKSEIETDDSELEVEIRDSLRVLEELYNEV